MHYFLMKVDKLTQMQYSLWHSISPAPPQNFAREIMQLFSIGLVQLHKDGTPKLDSRGTEILTYTNDDITEFARVWTGFTRQGPRGNTEASNSIDPMKIRVPWRDHYPKMGLEGKYIGDAYALCSDLPPDIFLRKGARWRLLGTSKHSDVQDLLLANESADNVAVTVLDQSSILARKLCEVSYGECAYPSVVDIKYNLACTGVECNLDSVRVVQVEQGVFYEFVRPPCVQFPFFEEGKRISKSRSDSNADSTCADRVSAVAAEACCNVNSIATYNTCHYTGERVPYNVAGSRCTDIGKELCEYNSLLWAQCDLCCNYSGFFWTDADCEVFAIVGDSGRVAIERQAGAADYESLTFFRVHWEGGIYPEPGNSCGNGFCETIGQFCRCAVEVEENRVFTTLPKRDEIISRLRIGGLDPYMADYIGKETYDDVIVHKVNSEVPYAKTTIFQVDDDFGKTLYMKNTLSMVKVGGFVFRNPPTFFSAVPEIRDAQYETEAALDHYLYHENTAPFLALRFIQRFGVSNPSPGFVERVANAFSTGRSEGLPNFGSGTYGDLGMTVAAIVMDRESRSVLLDSDPTYGSLREPLIKVIALMRNLDYRQTDGRFTSLHGLQISIGQESHEMPSVFSFFLPEYAPPGEFMSSSLVSPEASLLPNSLGAINGMLSMVKFGYVQVLLCIFDPSRSNRSLFLFLTRLSVCFGGFANNGWCAKGPEEGDFGRSVGRLAYLPRADDSDVKVVDDLATLLTSGRMSETNREIIRAQFTQTDDKQVAFRLAEQLALASPEFHATGESDTKGTLRADLPPRTKTCKIHKAVVHLLLKGGCDSYNMLVPHSNCDGNSKFSSSKCLL